MLGSRSSQPFASDGSRPSAEECPAKDPVLAMPSCPAACAEQRSAASRGTCRAAISSTCPIVARANWSILALKALAKGDMLELARGGMIPGLDTAWERSHRLPRQLAQRVLEAHAARIPPQQRPRGPAFLNCLRGAGKPSAKPPTSGAISLKPTNLLR